MKTIDISGNLEVCCDEAGRGSLIGRIYCGACIWPEGFETNEVKRLVKDSKKFTGVNAKRNREEAYDFVIKHAIAWNSAYGEAEDIDKYGLGKIWMDTMHRAILGINICPDTIIVDGNYFKALPPIENYTNYEVKTVIKGDSTYYGIAAASIIAKVEHDRHIEDLVSKYPYLDERYGLLSNNGYGTKEHTDAIIKYGSSEFHRKSFKGCS